MKQTISDRRLAANRANAQKSTGPKTPEGKERSSRNSLKHGITSRRIILTPEEQIDYDRLHDAYFARLKPVDGMEADLVEQIVHVRWHMGRIRDIEDTAFALTIEDPTLTAAFQYAHGPALLTLAHKRLADNSSQLALANRQLSRLSREYHRLLRTFFDLRRLSPPDEIVEPAVLQETGMPSIVRTTQAQNEPITALFRYTEMPEIRRNAACSMLPRNETKYD